MSACVEFRSLQELMAAAVAGNDRDALLVRDLLLRQVRSGSRAESEEEIFVFHGKS